MPERNTMPRTTETRKKTCDAAEKLRAEGKTPRQITVSLIHETIQQGSRSTINDALREWRKELEQAEVQQVPPELGPIIQKLWTLASTTADIRHSEEQALWMKEVADSHLAYDALEAQNKELTERLDASSQQLSDATSAATKFEAELTSARTDAEKATAIAETRIAGLDDALRETRDRAARGALESAQTLTAMAAEYEQREARLRADSQQAAERQDALLRESQENLTRAQQAAQTLERRLGAAEAEQAAQAREAAAMQANLARVGRELAEAHATSAEARAEAREATAALHSAEIETAGLRASLTAKEAALAAAEARRDDAETEASRLRDKQGLVTR